jgi:hypothetical protein
MNFLLYLVIAPPLPASGTPSAQEPVGAAPKGNVQKLLPGLVSKPIPRALVHFALLRLDEKKSAENKTFHSLA